MLQLGLTFCLDEDADKFELIKDFNLFARRLMYKVLCDNTVQNLGQQHPVLDNVTFEDLKALQGLIDL